MNIDLSFFDAVKAVWVFFFGFFPDWYQQSMAVVLGTFIAGIGLKVLKFLKDLLWPF